MVLDDLLGREAPEQVTLGWLMGGLGDRSFGVVLLVLALLGLLPGVSAVAGVLLMVPAFQMVLARPGPVFPRRVAARRFEAERLARVVRRVVPVLRWLERFIRPRWATPFEATKRVVGGVVLLLAASLLAPVPLSNIPPALVIGLIAFAYLEEDGALLAVALAAALVNARGGRGGGLGSVERDRLGAGHPVRPELPRTASSGCRTRASRPTSAVGEEEAVAEGLVVIAGKPSNLDGRRSDPREVCLLERFGPPRLAAAVHGPHGRAAAAERHRSMAPPVTARPPLRLPAMARMPVTAAAALFLLDATSAACTTSIPSGRRRHGPLADLRVGPPRMRRPPPSARSWPPSPPADAPRIPVTNDGFRAQIKTQSETGAVGSGSVAYARRLKAARRAAEFRQHQFDEAALTIAGTLAGAHLRTIGIAAPRMLAGLEESDALGRGEISTAVERAFREHSAVSRWLGLMAAQAERTADGMQADRPCEFFTMCDEAVMQVELHTRQARHDRPTWAMRDFGARHRRARRAVRRGIDLHGRLFARGNIEACLSGRRPLGGDLDLDDLS